MNLPTVQRHYLSREGDMVDEICWRYYGFTAKATEAVYSANPFLSKESAILPGMLLIVLPILSIAEVSTSSTYWPTVSRKLYTPASVAIPAEASTVSANTDGCCSDNAEVAESGEWLAVYVQNTIGDWVLKRIHISHLMVTEYGATTIAGSVDPTFLL